MNSTVFILNMTFRQLADTFRRYFETFRQLADTFRQLFETFLLLVETCHCSVNAFRKRMVTTKRRKVLTN